MIKLSMSLIKHLEEKGTWDHFREEYDKLHQRDRAYANTVAGVMDLAFNLNTRQQPYLVIGGLAVAGYVDQASHEGFLQWRGTNDIDLVVPDHDLGHQVLLEAGYKFSGEVMRRMPGAIGDVRVYNNDGNGEGKNETLVAGLRQGIAVFGRDRTSNIINHSSTVDIYSVPVRVPSLRDLIEMKTEANRKKDRADIKLLKTHYQGLKV